MPENIVASKLNAITTVNSSRVVSVSIFVSLLASQPSSSPYFFF